MNAFTYRMPAGIAGALTRTEHATVEPGIMDASAPFSAYGLPAKLSSGKYVPFSGSEAATALEGLLVRPFPTAVGSATVQSLGTSTPNQTGEVCDILKRGYMTVQLNGGATVAKGGQAYIRVSNAASGKPIGGIEGANDPLSQTGTSAAKSGGNTGDGTMGTVTVASGTTAGVYALRIVTAATNAGFFEVTGPDGKIVGTGNVAAAFSGGGLSFTLADGATDFVVGDGFDITVTSPSNTVSPAGLVFTGPADANGLVEVAYNI